MLKNNKQLQSALYYLQQGFSVLALKPREKTPRTLSWKEYQSHRTPEEKIRQWWDLWQDNNVAIICGRISGIVVVDADTAEGVAYAENNFPKTGVVVATGRGRHYYFRYNPHIRNSKLPVGIDVKSDGGYVLAPPSIHPTGKKYVFLAKNWDNIAELPLDCRELFTVNVKKNNRKTENNEIADKKYLSIFEQYLDGLREGNGIFSALCPFHQDKNPSFFFNANTGLWKCHSNCGSGNIHLFLGMLGLSKEKIREELIEAGIWRDYRRAGR